MSFTPMSTGWLTRQLPGALQRERVVTAFVGSGEEIADTIRFQLDALDAQLDPELASPRMLAYLAGWLGFAADASDDEAMLRRLVGRLGMIMRSRGTAWALGELLELLTGAPVRVVDPGGVFGPGSTVPPHESTVRIEVAQFGPLGAERLTAIARAELPVGLLLEIAQSDSVGAESSRNGG